MLKHVNFKVFGHLEGEIALNTGEWFVFSLHFHRLFFVQLMLFDQSGNRFWGKLETAERNGDWIVANVKVELM